MEEKYDELDLPRRVAKAWVSARNQRDAWVAAGDSVVFTNGCFDILHRGHVTYLGQARRLGQRLIVGLNDDASVRRLKGPSRPIQALADRAIVLAALRCVDLVVPFSEPTPLELIGLLQPHVLAKGGDYSPDAIVGAELVKSDGGRVEVLPFVEGYSTTSILARV